MAAYYNEIDPFAAAWLRELIARGLIAAGDVDVRSISDVRPTDLAGYTQVHLFAGIGGWSYALRLAVWPDARPVWTGSCHCQPFSAAGRRKGTDDERHLWPEMHRLVAQCCPPIIFGEQVAGAAGRSWIDLVFADLDALDYACGAADLCAAGVGAPHIRQRLYWVADAHCEGLDRGEKCDERAQTRIAPPHRHHIDRRGCSAWAVAHAVEGADNSWRVCPPGVQQMADGLSEGVGRLRGYGNAIVPQVAATFITAAMQALEPGA